MNPARSSQSRPGEWRRLKLRGARRPKKPGVAVGVGVGEGVGVRVGVTVAVAVAVGLGVGENVAVGLGEGVRVGVAVGVGEAVGELVGVAEAGAGWERAGAWTGARVAVGGGVGWRRQARFRPGRGRWHRQR